MIHLNNVFALFAKKTLDRNLSVWYKARKTQVVDAPAVVGRASTNFAPQ